MLVSLSRAMLSQIFHKSVYEEPWTNESYSALIRLSNIFYNADVIQTSPIPDQTAFLIRSNIKWKVPQVTMVP